VRGAKAAPKALMLGVYRPGAWELQAILDEGALRLMGLRRR
jgi:hypothetical protein